MEEGLSWPDAIGLALALIVAALVIWRNLWKLNERNGSILST